MERGTVHLQDDVIHNKQFAVLPVRILAANPEQVSIELQCITIGAEKLPQRGKIAASWL